MTDITEDYITIQELGEDWLHTYAKLVIGGEQKINIKDARQLKKDIPQSLRLKELVEKELHLLKEPMDSNFANEIRRIVSLKLESLLQKSKEVEN